MGLIGLNRKRNQRFSAGGPLSKREENQEEESRKGKKEKQFSLLLRSSIRIRRAAGITAIMGKDRNCRLSFCCASEQMT